MIAFEHPLKINKSASALLTGVLCWTVLIIGREAILGDAIGTEGVESLSALIDERLMEHLGDIAGILFFLLGAMTIVELVDAHRGFTVITDRISTTHKVKLIWILSIITFFLSATLDNLTTSIVMAALLRKLIKEEKDLWMFGGMVVIAANAGGAWSPIGDVTTIMLWIGGQITAVNIIKEIFVPSVVSMVVPLIVISFIFKGEVQRPDPESLTGFEEEEVPFKERRLILGLGIGSLLFVPVFKNLTHLPPFMGILLGLGFLWLATELIHKDRKHEVSRTVEDVLSRIDVPSVLFFLGILLAVASLEVAGHLHTMASFLDEYVGNVYLVNTIIGVLSSVVDNVPLVAGAMGMYPMSVYPQDHHFWELLAYCAGTGGSMLIIGSAAGVVIMGILRINFIWYLKRISWLAAIGYFAGVLTYWVMRG
jgi:Na+/H+ antiporter NhaD/arsenite permease-like protein